MRGFRFVRAARSRVPLIQDVIVRIGNAIVGGDFTGGPRGDYALDFQVDRLDPTNVASGLRSIAFGARSRAAGDWSLGLGFQARAAGSNAVAIGSTAITTISGVAIGSGAQVDGQYGMALGLSVTATGDRSNALGYGAISRVDETTVLLGPLIVPRGVSAGNSDFHDLCGVEVVLSSRDVDLLAIAEQEITFPTGCHFWLSELGLICTSLSGLVAQPTVRFGISGSPAKYLAATPTTLLAAQFKREKWLPLVPEDGETSLSAGVTVAANATEMRGRFYWKGMLVEDET